MQKIMNHVGCGNQNCPRKTSGWSFCQNWSESRSPEYESKAIKTVSKFARDYDCVIYFVHIGSKRALEQIEEEKKLGTKNSC